MMPRCLSLFLLLCGLGATAAPEPDVTALITAAQNAYEQGDYAIALVLYDSVAQKQGSAALYYNIGNCHFKLNDVPRAILNYERALLLSPGDEDVQANLDLARTLTVDRVNEIPGFTLGSSWDRFRGAGDPDRWARRSLWAGLLFFGLLAAAALLRPVVIKRLALIVAGIAFLLTATSIAFAWDRHAEVTAHDQAIVLAPKVDVTSEPRSGGTILFVLHEGTKVKVQGERNGWTEVKLANGNVGWMPEGSLEKI